MLHDNSSSVTIAWQTRNSIFIQTKVVKPLRRVSKSFQIFREIQFNSTRDALPEAPLPSNVRSDSSWLPTDLPPVEVWTTELLQPHRPSMPDTSVLALPSSLHQAPNLRICRTNRTLLVRHAVRYKPRLLWVSRVLRHETSILNPPISFANQTRRSLLFSKYEVTREEDSKPTWFSFPSTDTFDDEKIKPKQKVKSISVVSMSQLLLRVPINNDRLGRSLSVFRSIIMCDFVESSVGTKPIRLLPSTRLSLSPPHPPRNDW